MCLTADGICASDDVTLFVSQTGTDSGTCTRGAPCRQISFAYGVATPERYVVRILSGAYSMTPFIATSTKTFYVSGAGAHVTRSGGSGSMFDPQSGARLTLDGLDFIAPDSDAPAIDLETSATTRLVNVSFQNALWPVRVQSGTAEVRNCAFDLSGQGSAGAPGAIDCDGAILVVQGSSFVDSEGITGNCDFTIKGNRFANKHAFRGTGGVLTFENNLVTTSLQYTDTVFITDPAAGSVVRYNTWACTLDPCEDGRAISCSGPSPTISSNIFAWNTSGPFLGPCTPTYSIFDDTAGVITGDGNQVVPRDSIFASLIGGDFHLAQGSPAVGAADPADSDVGADIEGNPRPNPAGTVSDCGAFEAP